MLLIILCGALLVLLVVARVLRRRWSPGVRVDRLGCVSEQWIAEYHAAHP